MEAQQAAFNQGVQAQADGVHVADYLIGRLLEGEEEHALAPKRGGLGEVGGDDRLAGAGGAGEEDAAAAEEAAPAEHGVEAGDAGRDTLGGDLVIERQRRDGQHADTLVADEKGELVGAVHRTAILHHAQVAGGDLVVDPVIEQDDAVGDVFLKAMPGELLAAALGGDDGGDAFFFQPAEKPAQLRAQDGLFGQTGEEDLQGIQHHAFGADGVDGVAQPYEQTFEIVIAAFLGVAPLDVHVVEEDFFAIYQGIEVEAEGGHVGLEFRLGLLEGHEYAGFVELHRAAHQKLGREQGLAAAGAAADQGGPPPGKTAAGDFIETLDAGGAFGQTLSFKGGLGAFFLHGRSGWCASVARNRVGRVTR